MSADVVGDAKGDGGEGSFKSLLMARPQWVLWRLDPSERDPTKMSKTPYNAAAVALGMETRASATNLLTWTLKEMAESAASGLPGAQGVGVVTGPVAGTEWTLIGVDLDSCVDDNEIAEWASEVIDMMKSYAEESPSMTGVKIYARMRDEDVAAVVEMLGGTHGRKWTKGGGRAAGDHPPGIELYVGKRWFAWTGRDIPDVPDDIEAVSLETVERLIKVIGPGLTGKPWVASGTVVAGPWSGAGGFGGSAGSSVPAAALVTVDGGVAGGAGEISERIGRVAAVQSVWEGKSTPAEGSRSSWASKLLYAMYGAGFSWEDGLTAVREWPQTAGWPDDKAQPEREFLRAWNAAAALWNANWQAKMMPPIAGAVRGVAAVPEAAMAIGVGAAGGGVGAPKLTIVADASVQARVHSCTDKGMADLFVQEWGDGVRYDHTNGRWYRLNGHNIWEPQYTEGVNYQVQEMLYRVATDSKVEAKVYQKMLSAAMVGSVEKLAKANPVVAVTSDIWDQDTWLAGTPGGVLDLRTGGMVDIGADAYVSRKMKVAPAPSGTPHPMWTEFLRQATQGDGEMEHFLQQLAGYCLTGETREQCFFFAHGQGGNGKGTYVRTLATLLGDYAKPVAITTFTKTKHEKHPADLDMLRGARLAYLAEGEGKYEWDEQRLKLLSGGDEIQARGMGQDFTPFMPHFKIMIALNQMPKLNDTGPSMQQRLNMLPFRHRIPERDMTMEDRMRVEHSAILRWAIDGCLDWQRNGLQRPACVVLASQDYLSSDDTIGQWIADKCDVGPRAMASSSELFESYKVYCATVDSTVRPGRLRDFKMALQGCGYRYTEHLPGNHNARGFVGLQLKGTARSAFAVKPM